jgi:type I restriction enzyme M protein
VVGGRGRVSREVGENLDIFWLRDQSLEDSDDLPKPDVLAEEIADDLEAALEQFTAIAAKLKNRA